MDPVLLIQGKDVSGKADLKVVRGPFEYLFSSPATKATFESDPARYEIQLGGLCARMGKATGGRPADYLVYEGKIYVFGSDECHKKFDADPKKYLAAPAPPIAVSGRAVTDGHALLDRAVAAVGGSKKLSAINTYVETASQTQKRPSGDVPVTIKTMWRFPDAVRMERTMTIQERTMSSATLMTPAGMWYLSQGHAYPALEAGRPSMQLDYGRQIVPLLRSSRETRAKIASLGKGTVHGINVERVRVVNGAVDMTWRDRSVTRSTLIGDRRRPLPDPPRRGRQPGLATPGESGLTVCAKAQILQERAWTAPTLVGTTLYVRDRHRIMALELGRK